MKKIILGLGVVLILFLLLHASFSAKSNSSLEEIKYLEIKNGNYLLNFDEDSFFFEEGESKDGLNINYLNPFDKILYVGDISIENTTINIGKGVYLLNILELNSKYAIKGNGFLIENNGPTIIFIDTSGTRTNIFSQNNIIDLKLINELSESDEEKTELDEEKVVNNVYLYPHTFIRFTPSYNKNVEAADILKLTQWFPIDYFEEKILEKNAVNENFVSKVIGVENKNLENIKKMFIFLGNDNKNEETNLDSSKFGKFGNVIQEKWMKNYSSLFLNNAKKIVYYKNLVLRGIGNLINSNEIKEGEVSLLVDTMNDIKKLNQSDYEEMKSILYFYSNLIISGYKSETNAKINFSKIYNLLEGKSFDFVDQYIFSINNTYLKLDIETKIDTQKYNEMYKELSEIIEFLVNLNLDEKQKSYLVFFLNKSIISAFNLSINIQNILNILDKYTEISYGYYSGGDDVVIRTGIAEYSVMIKELLVEIGKFFFEEEKDGDCLIIINSISSTEVKKLEANINKIFTYFEDNKNKLQDKEKTSYIESFEESKKISTDYFSAINDYDNYKISCKKQEELFSGEKTTNTLNIDEALKYLQGFNYINLSNTKISLRNINYCNHLADDEDKDEYEDPYCYKIENFIVNNKVKLGFLLTPDNSNEISHITIDEEKEPEKNKGSYKLDTIKEEWKKLDERNSGSADPERYKFGNFFYYTFSGETKSPITSLLLPDDEEEIDLGEETQVIRALKTNLLSKGRELNNIGGGFITITYNNLIVKEIQSSSNFDIEIQKAKMFYAISSSNTRYYGDFEAKYVYPGDILKNPSIMFYDERNNYLLYGNKIKFNGEFKTQEIKNNFETFFENFSSLSNILSVINYNLNTSQFEIIYNDINYNDLTISNNIIKLQIRREQIHSINYNNKEILKKYIPISDLNETLQLIQQ